MENAKAAIAGAYASDEHSVMQAINSYNSVEKVRNLMYERLEEWYSIYFPELRLSTPDSYAKFVISFGSRKNSHSIEEMRAALGEKADSIQKAAADSIGRDPSLEEYEAMKSIAESQLALQGLQERLDAYLKESATKLMPNITYLVEYKIAAELLAKAGSLKRLAMLPASTVQLLGAEKSLFKHIKFGTRPPKYGILYKLPAIQGAGKHNGGRLARMYATKISIAAKADAFSKNFIAEQLKESIDKYTPKNEGERKNAVRYEDSAQHKAFQERAAEQRQGSGNRFGSMGKKYERPDPDRPRYRDASKQEFRDNKSSFRDNYSGERKPTFRRDAPQREEQHGGYQRERPAYRPNFRTNDRPEGRNYSRERPEGRDYSKPRQDGFQRDRPDYQRGRPSFQREGGSSFKRERPYRLGHGGSQSQGREREGGFRPNPRYGSGGSSYNREGNREQRPRYSPREGQSERPTSSYGRSNYRPEGGYRSEGTRTTAASRPEFRKKFSDRGEKRDGDSRGRYGREGSRPQAKKFRKKR